MVGVFRVFLVGFDFACVLGLVLVFYDGSVYIVYRFSL